MNWEPADVPPGFRKGRRTRDQIANIHWIIENAREFQKNNYFCFIDYAKAFDWWITTNWGKFLNRLEYQTTLPASCLTQVNKQQLELNMEQQTGSKLGKEYVKDVYCHHAYLTYMQSTSWETLGWMNHRLEWRLLGEYQSPQIRRWHHPYGRKGRGTKESLDESERGE